MEKRSLLLLFGLTFFPLLQGCSKEEAPPPSEEPVSETSLSVPQKEPPSGKKSTEAALPSAIGPRKGEGLAPGGATSTYSLTDIVGTYEYAGATVEVPYSQFLEAEKKISLINQACRKEKKVQDKEVWRHILLLNEARDSGIVPTAKDFNAFCSEKVLLRNFNMNILKKELGVMEISFKNFLEAAKEKLMIDKYLQTLTLFVRVTDEEVFKRYGERNKRYKISYLCLKAEDFLDRVAGVDDEEEKLEEAEKIAREEIEKFRKELQARVNRSTKKAAEKILVEASESAEKEIKEKGINRPGQKRRIQNEYQRKAQSKISLIKKEERAKLLSDFAAEKGIPLATYGFFTFPEPRDLQGMEESGSPERYIQSQMSLSRLEIGGVTNIYHNKRGKAFFLFRMEEKQDAVPEEMDFQAQIELSEKEWMVKKMDLDHALGDLESLEKRYQLKSSQARLLKR